MRTASMKWLNLEAHGLSLVLFNNGDPTKRLSYAVLDPYRTGEYNDTLTSLGFTMNSKGTWINPSYEGVSFGDIREKFPLATVEDIELARIFPQMTTRLVNRQNAAPQASPTSVPVEQKPVRFKFSDGKLGIIDHQEEHKALIEEAVLGYRPTLNENNIYVFDIQYSQEALAKLSPILNTKPLYVASQSHKGTATAGIRGNIGSHGAALLNAAFKNGVSCKLDIKNQQYLMSADAGSGKVEQLLNELSELIQTGDEYHALVAENSVTTPQENRGERSGDMPIDQTDESDDQADKEFQKFFVQNAESAPLTIDFNPRDPDKVVIRAKKGRKLEDYTPELVEALNQLEYIPKNGRKPKPFYNEEKVNRYIRNGSYSVNAANPSKTMSNLYRLLEFAPHLFGLPKNGLFRYNQMYYNNSAEEWAYQNIERVQKFFEEVGFENVDWSSTIENLSIDGKTGDKSAATEGRVVLYSGRNTAIIVNCTEYKDDVSGINFAGLYIQDNGGTDDPFTPRTRFIKEEYTKWAVDLLNGRTPDLKSVGSASPEEIARREALREKNRLKQEEETRRKKVVQGWWIKNITKFPEALGDEEYAGKKKMGSIVATRSGNIFRAVEEHREVAGMRVKLARPPRKGDRREDIIMVLPVYHELYGEPVGVQRLASHVKEFTAGTPSNGAFHPLNEYKPGSRVFVAEGYATAASVLKAYPDAFVVAAIHADNIMPAIEAILAKHPDADITVAADNDVDKPHSGNKGMRVAIKASHKHGVKIAPPRFDKLDTYRTLRAPDGGHSATGTLMSELGTPYSEGKAYTVLKTIKDIPRGSLIEKASRSTKNGKVPYLMAVDNTHLLFNNEKILVRSDGSLITEGGSQVVDGNNNPLSVNPSRPSDFNDLDVDYGIDETRRHLAKTFKAPQSAFESSLLLVRYEGVNDLHKAVDEAIKAAQSELKPDTQYVPEIIKTIEAKFGTQLLEDKFGKHPQISRYLTTNGAQPAPGNSPRPRSG